MSIHLNSRLRVLLPFVDVLEDVTETPIDLTAFAERSVRIIKPDGSEITNPQLDVTNPAAGEGGSGERAGPAGHLDGTGDC